MCIYISVYTICVYVDADSQPRPILLSKGHLTMSVDISGSPKLGMKVLLVSSAQRLGMPLNIPQQREQPKLSGASVHVAEVGRSWHICSSEARSVGEVCMSTWNAGIFFRAVFIIFNSTLILLICPLLYLLIFCLFYLVFSKIRDLAYLLNLTQCIECAQIIIYQVNERLNELSVSFTNICSQKYFCHLLLLFDW